MIHVDHKTFTPPSVLTDPKEPGQIETAKAVAYFSRPRRRGRAPKFKAYKHESVKKALEGLFHGKCAYCESSYAATQPVDVEHWRPKACVLDDAGNVVCKDGYYWLAASWTNLLPSCIDCNRVREQALPGGTSANSGKGNRFPIEDDLHRARKPGQESGESPLLLHPYFDEPSKHLTFVVRNEGVVVPSTTPAGNQDPKGARSIQICGLNRTGLVQSRKEVLLLIVHSMMIVERLTALLDQNLPANIVPVLEDLLSREMARLADFQRPNRQYAQMARQVIKPFVAALTT